VNAGIYAPTKGKNMKKLVGFILLVLVLASSCVSPKPYYETAEGKKKQQYYNDVFYGRQKQSYRH